MLPLVLLLADVDPPREGDVTRVVLSPSAQVTPESSSYGASGSGSNSSGVRGGGDLGATFYPWAPLVDDESPRSLQAFLQRTSFVGVSTGAQFISVSYSAAAQGGTYTQAFVPATASARYFVAPSVAILAGAGVDYLHDVRTPTVVLGRTRDLWEPFGSIGIDARAGDASFTVDWEAIGVSQSVTGAPAASPPGVFWGRVTLGGRFVIDRRFDLAVNAGLLPDGGTARASFAAYPTKELGLSAFARFDHGHDLDQTTDYDRVQAGPAASLWLSPRVELSLSYAPQWTRRSDGASTVWDHVVTLGATFRVP